MLNPNYQPKVLPKEALEVPKNWERKRINSRKIAKPCGQGAARPCHDARPWVRRTGDRASKHGHGMTVLLGLLALWDFCLRCMVVQPYWAAVSSAVFLCFAFVDARGFV